MERFLVTLISFLVLIANGASIPISCPTDEDLSPCTCKRMAYGLHVICANFDDTSDLVRAIKVLRDFRVQNFLLHGLKMTEVLPSDIFDGLQINHLRVENSKLKFSEPAFSGLDNTLHVLNVAQHSMIKSSENFSLARLNKLTELTIKANPIGTVRDIWLNGKVPNVRSILLDEDEITKIEKRAFADLVNLESISIAGNRIKVVERSMFPRPANKLKRIDLSENEIQKLPFDFFFDMPKLEEVVFSGNDLTSLPENTWRTVWEQLNSILLFNNKLTCNEDLNWIKNLRSLDNRQVEGKCAGPPKMYGKSLKEFYNT